MHTPDEDNAIFKTAADFIHNSNHPVFLTGKAGTGKTTFLKYIKENTTKNTAIVAPTGVAAINAGGTTIHSFFQLPFTPFLPSGKKNFGQAGVNDRHNIISKLKLNAERKEILQQLELLIIDEISMVRCDVLDAIDAVLRYVRNQHSKPFGGVQVLYIGDMFQLPPVIKDDEWKILSSCYENRYFFNSNAIAEQQPVFIELKKVYRQSDSVFIDLLNQVRNNEMNENSYSLLHSRYSPSVENISTDNYITLTTHNSKADSINIAALSRLPGKTYSYKAAIDGSFYENAYPADELLHLKVGAQVMFIKNDLEKIRRYYNGKIGVVERIEDEKIFIDCTPGTSGNVIEVKKETWKNIQYVLDSKTKQIAEKELGSFTQYPLRLAWAITIHKSQGLTFEKVIIDAERAFAPGQVYVALSRCMTLEGIILQSRISQSSLYTDQPIISFSSKQQNDIAQTGLLQKATKQYQEEIIQYLFDFKQIDRELHELQDWIRDSNGFGTAVAAWLDNINSGFRIYNQHGDKFKQELHGFFSDETLPEENEQLQERLMKASSWFYKEILKTQDALLLSPANTDNRQLALEYNYKLEKLLDQISHRIYLLNTFKTGFSLLKYHELKSGYKKEPFPLNAYAGKSNYISKNILHPDLYVLLKDKRNDICKEKNLPVYIVCNSQSLEEMAQYLPQTLNDLGKINGFGSIKLKQFGSKFIDIINNYCEANNIQSTAHTIPEKKIKKYKEPRGKTAPKTDSKEETYKLYVQGKSLPEIAEARNLALSTIEGHLTEFIEKGKINIDQLIKPEKQEEIRDLLKITGDTSLHDLKQQLPSATYGEIKWVRAALNRC